MNHRSRLNDWSQQSQRIYDYMLMRRGESIKSPQLNSIAAGPAGLYVSSFSKRMSEVRRKARANGYKLLKSIDRWLGRQRQTEYKLV
jgi:hypothetical protein